MIREYFKERDRKARHAAIRSLHTDPRAARHWHNPADPVQAARIEAAAVKRERKARKLAANTGRATFHNRAHGIHCIAVAWKQFLNPTYIAK